MAEVKNSFIKSKMNKDLDARLLPNGEYREGINIQVSKSEGADVGALENVLGNTKLVDFKVESGCNCDLETIGLYTDEVSSNIYIFLTDYDETVNTSDYIYKPQSLNYSTTANNYIYLYNVSTGVATQLLSGAFLNFSKNKPIIGVNLLEGILFWTDNRNQPRRINVERALNDSDSTYYTSEDQISVATYAPFQPINLYYKREDAFLPNGGSAITTGTALAGQNSVVLDAINRLGLAKELDTGKTLIGSLVTSDVVGAIPANTALGSYSNGNTITLISQTALPGAETPVNLLLDLPPGTQLYFNQNTLTDLSTPNYYVTSMLDASSKMNPGSAVDYSANYPGYTTNPNYNPKFNGDPDFLEDKFVKFSYRFKYNTGEYSVMAPFTQAAFIPKQDGYFLNNTTPTGMTSDEQSTYRSTVVDFMENKVNNIILQIPTPLDENNNNIPANELFGKLKIDEIEILYKESDGLAIRVVDSISWDGTGGYAELGGANIVIPYNYQGTKPYKTLPESEITRVYDKVPVRALGQEIISNRVVYSNFQNKHTPPETLNYNVAVSEKYTNFVADDPLVPAPLYKTSSREYPMHTVKQNRNYQIGVVLSDKFGRSSSTILSSATIQSTDEDDLTLLGDTIYFPYNNVSSTDNALNNINDWAGDSIKVLFNSIIPNFPPDLQNGWPGVYNGDSTDPKYNPLGWYSYKIVVKQTEQDYYNVYLPGLMNFYPPITDDPDVAGSVSYITLLNDNINKVPRDLTEVGPEQKQFRSSVQLYGRVAPEYDALAPDPLYNYQFNPINTATDIALSDTVATISDQNDLFDNTTPIKFGSIYQTASNPSMARVSISQNIGSAEPATSTTAINTWLSIYETEPVESKIDIYWETSTSGTIADLNEAIQTVAGIKGFTTDTSSNPPSTWTFNLFEDITPGQSPNVIYNGTYANATVKEFHPYTEDSSGLKTAVANSMIEGAVSTKGTPMPITQQPGFQVVNNNGDDVSDKFKLVRNAVSNPSTSSPVNYEIFINDSTFFYFGADSVDTDSYTFTFQVEDLDGDPGNITTLTFNERLLNKAPQIQDCPSNGVTNPQAGSLDLITLTAQNGTSNADKNTQDLTWGIAYGLNQTSGFASSIPASLTDGLPEITIIPDGGSATIRDESQLLNVGYPITVAVTDAGSADTTYPLPNGTPTTTCSFTINASVGYDSDILNTEFYAAKNVCISKGPESSIFGWGGVSSSGFYDPADLEGFEPGFENVPPFDDPQTNNPTTGGTVVQGSGFVVGNCDTNITNNEWKFYSINRNANIRVGSFPQGFNGLDGERIDQTSNAIGGQAAKGLTAGTAYIIVDFVLKNYGEIPTGGSGRYQPSITWPTVLQYRPSSNDPWSDAYDIEGKLIKFGGAQINNQAISPNSSSLFLGTGILDNDTESYATDNTFFGVDGFQSIYTGKQIVNEVAPNSIGRKIFAIGRNSAYRNDLSTAPDRYGEYRLAVRYPFSDNIKTDLTSNTYSGPTQGNKILPAISEFNTCPGTLANGSSGINGYSQPTNAINNQQVFLSYGDFYNPVQLLNTYHIYTGSNTVTQETQISNPTSYEYRISTGYDTRNKAAAQTPSQQVYAREWAFKYISQLYTDPGLTTTYKPNITGSKYFSYCGADNGELNVVWGNENSNSQNGGSPPQSSGSSTQSSNSQQAVSGQPYERRWTAQFDSFGMKVIQTSQPCVGGSVVNPNTNFRTLSSTPLPTDPPAGGIQYGKMNIDQNGTYIFRCTFNNASLSGEALMQALTVNSPTVGTRYSPKASATSLVIFLGESPYSQQLNIELTTTNSIIVWQRFNNRDTVEFQTTTTDLSLIGFPANSSNFYWVIS